MHMYLKCISIEYITIVIIIFTNVYQNQIIYKIFFYYFLIKLNNIFFILTIFYFIYIKHQFYYH